MGLNGFKNYLISVPGTNVNGYCFHSLLKSEVCEDKTENWWCMHFTNSVFCLKVIHTVPETLHIQGVIEN